LVVGVTTVVAAAAAGNAEKAGAESVAVVDTGDEPCTDEATGVGADAALRSAVDAEVEAAAGFELRVGGRGVLVVVEPGASPL
jgi:hypothetical protein